jgi:hypothetical protein
LYCAECLRIAFEAETDDEHAGDQHDAQKRRCDERTERHEVKRIHKIHAKCHDILPKAETGRSWLYRDGGFKFHAGGGALA